MSRPSLRSVLACAVVAAGCVSLFARPVAAQRTPPIVRFDAKAQDTSGPRPASAGRIEIALERWSSAADEENLRKAIAGGSDAMLSSLKSMSSAVGVMLSPGIQGTGDRARVRRRQPILFARDIKTPTGRRVILATDEQVTFSGAKAERARPTQNQFTFVDIRFDAKGKGIGKVGPASQVTYNTKTRTLELGDYDKAPSDLIDVTTMKR
jgi:hypothetical protein